MRTVRQRVLVLFLATGMLGGLQSCGGGGGGTSTSTGIDVQIAGLAATSDGHVTVSGNGITRLVTQSLTITNLSAGQYTVKAEQVLTGRAVMAPTPVTQMVTVTAEQITTVTVSYNELRSLSLQLHQIIPSGLLSAPIFLASPPNDPRLFIAERAGVIRIWDGTKLLTSAYLDISSSGTNNVLTDGERGLLSFAFDPQYATNHFVFVHYTDRNGDIVVERFQASGDQVNLVTRTIVTTIQHRMSSNHNGGTIAFGPDGALWISTGDGDGGIGDPFNNAQSISSLLGKMLRIDPTLFTPAPPTPFGNAIWAVGLRNPFRWAFDRDTNTNQDQVYIADVGENRFEEVDVVGTDQAAVNYGWPIMEGDACFPGDPCDMSGLTLPVQVYDHSMGCSIIGGYVYRGTAIPDLQGRYFYSDFCAGFLRSFRFSSGVATERIDWNITRQGSVFSFGQDSNRELYVIADDRVLQIVPGP